MNLKVEKFELNLPGLNELMKSSAMQSALRTKGNQCLANANGMHQEKGASYSTETKTLNWIAITTVRCANSEAVKDCMKNNTLLKALK